MSFDQNNPAVEKDILFTKVQDKLYEANFEERNQFLLEEFIEENYPILKDRLEEAAPRAVVRNFLAYKKHAQLSNKILTEAEDTVEAVDKTALFQDLAEVQAHLSDSFAKLYIYKNQFIDNQNWRVSLSAMRVAVSELINKMSATMQMIGTENDAPKGEPVI